MSSMSGKAISRRTSLLIAAPVLTGLFIGLGFAVVRPSLRVVFTVHPGLLVLLFTAAVSMLSVLFVLDRRTAAAARAKERQEAEDTYRADHRRFLDRLDHELKNPITAVRAALAAHDGPRSAHLQAADSQSARLAELVAELRKLAELRSYPLEYEQVGLTELTHDAVASVQEQLATAHGVHRDVVVSFPTAPWQIPPIWADPDLLFLAIYNVLSNAAKFTQDGDRIEVRAGEVDGSVELEIADTGIGIPSDELGSVWEELSRASNARATPGSGLGLALVRVVVERHGGTVALRSRPGEGTSVRMRLPIRPAHE